MVKKALHKIHSVFSSAATRAAVAARSAADSIRTQVLDDKAEGYVDTGVKILIAVVIGALLMTLLYGLFSETIFPTLSQKIQGLFNYTGSGN